jgi:hypothetical protein
LRPFVGFDRLIREQLRRQCDASEYGLDCFVSSEVSYNQAIASCRKSPGSSPGGSYVGVGPEQNYSYIAALRHDFAVIVDARLDNLLEHLWFKLLLERAESPLEFLASMFQRAIPSWLRAEPASGAELLGRLKRCPVLESEFSRNWDWLAKRLVERWDMPATLVARTRRICEEFYRRQTQITSVSGPSLAALDEMPTFEDVLSSRTAEGFNFHFLTDTERFSYIQHLHRLDRIVPVLGNLSSSSDIDDVAELVRSAGSPVETIYISNMEEFLVERYHIGSGTGVTERPNPAGMLEGEWGKRHARLFENLSRLSPAPDCMLIRYYLPATYRGRALGVFPWLVPHVAFFDRLLKTCTRTPPASLLETYF